MTESKTKRKGTKGYMPPIYDFKSGKKLVNFIESIPDL